MQSEQSLLEQRNSPFGETTPKFPPQLERYFETRELEVTSTESSPIQISSVDNSAIRLDINQELETAELYFRFENFHSAASMASVPTIPGTISVCETAEKFVDIQEATAIHKLSFMPRKRATEKRLKLVRNLGFKRSLLRDRFESFAKRVPRPTGGQYQRKLPLSKRVKRRMRKLRLYLSTKTWREAIDRLRFLKRHEACNRNANVCGNERPASKPIVHRTSARCALRRIAGTICAANGRTLRPLSNAREMLRRTLRKWSETENIGLEVSEEASFSDLSTARLSVLPDSEALSTQTSIPCSFSSDDMMTIATPQDFQDGPKIDTLPEFMEQAAFFKSHVTSSSLCSLNDVEPSTKIPQETFSRLEGLQLPMSDCDYLENRDEEVSLTADQASIYDTTIPEEEPHKRQYRDISIPGIDEWSLLSDDSSEDEKSACVSGIDQWSLLSETEIHVNEIDESETYDSTPPQTYEISQPMWLETIYEEHEGEDLSQSFISRIYADNRRKLTILFDPISEEEEIETEFTKLSFIEPALFELIALKQSIPVFNFQSGLSCA